MIISLTNLTQYLWSMSDIIDSFYLSGSYSATSEETEILRLSLTLSWHFCAMLLFLLLLSHRWFRHCPHASAAFFIMGFKPLKSLLIIWHIKYIEIYLVFCS